ncbi:solute carrier family 35 member G2-like [Branchiostoma floridae]|uniref:Solute carrier family 35 member G2-like n=1 Tax=Branchiostoma floridae TaxID=7739 RepID=A0A9J7LG56_BRAFL|nr:solute carrier family 35 member G2-like [Branchiostoma floridae]
MARPEWSDWDNNDKEVLGHIAMTQDNEDNQSLQWLFSRLQGNPTVDGEFDEEEREKLQLEQLKEEPKNLLLAGEGLFLALLSGVSLSSSSILARLAANSGVPDMQVVFFNELAAFILFVPLVLACRGPLLGENWKHTGLLFLAGVGRTFVTIWFYVSVFYIPPGNSFAIQRGATPLFAALMALAFLGEKPGCASSIGIILNLIGVVLLTQGPNYGWEELDKTLGITPGEEPHVSPVLIGNALAIVSALGLAAVNVVSRGQLASTPLLTVLFWMESLGVAITLPLMYVFPKKPVWDLEGNVYGYLTGAGFIYTVGIACLYRSLKLEKTATVALLRNGNVVLAYLMQVFILHITPAGMEIAGAVLVLISTAIATMVTWLQNWRERSEEVRQRLEAELADRKRSLGNGSSRKSRTSRGSNPNSSNVVENDEQRDLLIEK